MEHEERDAEGRRCFEVQGRVERGGGDGGIWPWKCVYLACDEDVYESRQRPPDCGDVLISERNHHPGSLLSNINAPVNSSQSEPRPNSLSNKRAGHSSLRHRHRLESHKTLTYSKLRRLLLQGSEANDVSDDHRVALLLGRLRGTIRKGSELRIDGEGVDVDEGVSS